MRLSLRVQLGAAIVLVTSAVLALVLASTERRLVEEFARFDGGADTTVVAEAARRLEPWYAGVRDFTWPGADSVLATVPRPPRLELVLQSSSGLVVAATRADLRRATLSGGAVGNGELLARSPRGGGTLVPPGARPGRPTALVLTMNDERGGQLLRLLFDAPPRRELHAPDGRLAGIVYSLYMPSGGTSPGAGRARGAVNRALLVPVLLGAFASIVLLVAASSTLLSPLRALTEATRRLARGDRGARVPVAGASEVAELATAFNGMAESLERTEAARRQLVTDVAHELRTPLTNLRCRLEAMQDGLAPADASALRSLHDETLLLGRLVEDLQLLSLADAGRLPLDIRRADVRELAARAVAATAPRAEGAGVALVLEAPGEAWAACDSERVGQMLRSLLDNALAHTPAGGTVTVGVASPGEAVTIEVRDTGAGLAPGHVAHVFDRFWRADPARARERGGSGLGLAIVRQLAELQGGGVSVASPPGEGARFTVRLPGAGAFTPPS